MNNSLNNAKLEKLRELDKDSDNKLSYSELIKTDY
jgi:hypothetical protein